MTPRPNETALEFATRLVATATPEVLAKTLDNLAEHSRITERDLRAARVVLTCITIALVVMTFKFLCTVDMPVPSCLHPATFKATQLELAEPVGPGRITL